MTTGPGAAESVEAGGAAERPRPPAACPICGGSGQLQHIDEEVGCQVAVPCWSCRGSGVAPRPPDPGEAPGHGPANRGTGT